MLTMNVTHPFTAATTIMATVLIIIWVEDLGEKRHLPHSVCCYIFLPTILLLSNVGLLQHHSCFQALRAAYLIKARSLQKRIVLHPLVYCCLCKYSWNLCPWVIQQVHESWLKASVSLTLVLWNDMSATKCMRWQYHAASMNFSSMRTYIFHVSEASSKGDGEGCCCCCSSWWKSESG